MDDSAPQSCFNASSSAVQNLEHKALSALAAASRVKLNSLFKPWNNDHGDGQLSLPPRFFPMDKCCINVWNLT